MLLKTAYLGMWYFLIKQNALDTAQFKAIQKLALLTDVESFNDPYENWYIIEVEKDGYANFIDHLDRQGIAYDLTADRPTRAELLDGMR